MIEERRPSDRLAAMGHDRRHLGPRVVWRRSRRRPGLRQCIADQRPSIWRGGSYVGRRGWQVAVVPGEDILPPVGAEILGSVAAVKTTGKPVTLDALEAYNHFEVAEQLANPYSLFGRAVLEQMKLRPT
jgi:hypothetical protein